ncbi:ABC transporter permease [Ketogulonicigenium vulgare]|uniref:ABC transporter permease n=2 Tax=Ketogulonicigenium vulgare TaxID=92945 RepID=UPI001F3440FB|nr:iron ABC transporter permease [Ketogulonicigenium vulgare]
MTDNGQGAVRKRRPPLILVLPAVILAVGTCLPVIYLLIRAFGAGPDQIAQIILRPRILLLLGNTLQLVALVLLLGTLIALPMAWLVTQTNLRGRRIATWLMVLPLAVPGYVMAYALIGMSGYYGFLSHWFGITLPPLRGLWGAGLALTLYTFPYIFLHLRAAFLGMDGSLVESARSLGLSPLQAFLRIILPQLWPALVSSWLIVGLYVIGDFGAIALMRYEVFSYAIYTQYAGAFDRTTAAWLALILLGLTLIALWAQARVTRNRRFSSGTLRRAQALRLGRWQASAWGAIALIALCSLGLPLLVLGHWMRLGLPDFNAALLVRAMAATALLAAPAAAIAVALALPVSLLALRYPGWLPRLTGRLAYLGYATPPLPLALAMVFMVLALVPMLYQSHAVLIFAYVISFAAIALGPLRLALMQIPARQEEAARALGKTAPRAFARVTLPRLRRPALAAGVLVFVMIVKDLPLAYMLAPTGTRTLAMSIFAWTSEGMMANAAPFALLLLIFCACFVGLFLKYESGAARR